MKRVLAMIAVSAVVAVPLTAELRREAVPMDRVPWELAEPRLRKGVWWNAPHIPIDHPYWWTLTNDVRPEQLKEELEKHTEALQSEPEPERRGATVQTDRGSRVVRIVDGQQNPQLFPVWSIFFSFANGKAKDDPEETLRDLRAHGIEASAAESILRSARETLESADEVGRQAGAAALQLRSLLLQTTEKLGSEKVAELRRSGNFALLGEQVGWSESSLHDLARSAYRNWEAAAAVPSIVSLRRTIGERQWDLFRGYLLAEVASRRSDTVILR